MWVQASSKKHPSVIIASNSGTHAHTRTRLLLHTPSTSLHQALLYTKHFFTPNTSIYQALLYTKYFYTPSTSRPKRQAATLALVS